MVLNDIKMDVKLKCIEADTNQTKLGEVIGTTGQYVNRVMSKDVVNKTFVKMMEAMGYDIELVYIPKK